MLGASQVALLGAASAAITYDSLVGIFGADVVSYWKFAGNATDERGTQDAIFTGSPEPNVDTIVDLDTIAEGALVEGRCIAWPGSAGVFAQAAHNPGHKTAEGTIVVTFQHDTLGQKSTLVAADANAAAGGLSLEVQADGAPRSFLRRQSDGAPVPLLGQPGDVQLNTAYTLVFKWGAAGLSMTLWDQTGSRVRQVSNALSDGVTGTSPIRFGAWHTGISQHDGPYGRVIWLKRRISDQEEAVLARARTIVRAAFGSVLLGAWPLSETSGAKFGDTVGANDATLTVPTWTIPTHEHNRPGIVAGSDHALEVSNGGPAIPMAAAYKQAEMSLVLYIEPRGELRGVQYWNEGDERFGREFIAYCDDGSTPGSFAIYRRRNGVAGLVGISGTPQWRLGGYVRDSSGNKVYFGGGASGISSTALPVDSAKRVVLTQGLTGAKLYLDDSEAASLPVTQGWSLLTAPISLGSSSSTGHATDRSPFWGRLDQVEVWQGQLSLAQVQARPAATQSLLYRLPTDGPLVNLASHGGNIQAAMDAAHAVGGYVYQDETTDTTYKTLGISTTIGQRSGCRGMVGVRIKRPSNQNQSGRRLLVCSTESSGGSPTLGTHGDPFAASGGYRYIGCKFDGNARGQNWAPTGTQATADGKANSAFDFQFAHIFMTSSSSGRVTTTFDACEFFDNTGDAISLSINAAGTVKSCRFYGTYRGPVIFNEFVNQTYNSIRNEMHVHGRMSGAYANMGCGLCDLEPFQPGGSLFNRWICADCWSEGDWDDRNYEIDGTTTRSVSLYYNVHITCGPPVIQPDRTGSAERKPTHDVQFQRCTISYYKVGYRSSGATSGSFPPCMLRGFTPGPNGTGALFEECVFLANGRPFNYHEFGIADPAIDSSPLCRLDYQLANGPSGRLMTLRNCQFRVTRLPSGITLANTRAIAYPSGMGTGRQIELDGVTIDAAFANEPFAMGGATVRHRNVVHERTGDTTPWTGAGAEVAF